MSSSWGPERFDQDEGNLGLILSNLLGNIALDHCGYSSKNNFSLWGLLLNWSFILPFLKKQVYWTTEQLLFFGEKKQFVFYLYKALVFVAPGKNWVPQQEGGSCPLMRLRSRVIHLWISSLCCGRGSWESSSTPFLEHVSVAGIIGSLAITLENATIWSWQAGYS